MKNNKLKIAVVYRGMYLRAKPNSKAMNFFTIIQNNKDKLLNKLTTYDLFYETTSTTHEFDSDLMKKFPAKKVSFKHGNKHCMDSVLNSLQMYDFTEYDFIFNIRFGLKFNKSIDQFNIDYTKFNYLWKEPKKFNPPNITRVSDHIFAFPTCMLDNVMNMPKYFDEVTAKEDKLSHYCLHFLNLDQSKLNSMVEGYHWSGGHKSDPEGKKYLEILRYDTKVD